MLARQGIEELRARRRADGAFAARPGAAPGIDATAWAVVALTAAGEPRARLEPSLAWLAARQQEDGRVPLDPELDEVIWPTPLAMLAWSAAGTHPDRLARAAEFLLRQTGRHWERKPEDPVAHDTSIRGWPWVLGTHSWVVPTALALLALRRAGRGDHPRVAEGAAMLVDRQLPGGGWNYGNTVVFGQRLRPMADTTGVALAALAGLTPREKVAASLHYLEGVVNRIRTPLSLGWGLLGLAAWDVRPAAAADWIEESLAASARAGPYETAALAVLLTAAWGPQGLLETPGG
jgi:hypothetical protein